MRLLNTSTLTFEHFFYETPEYAILSHTWEGNELTLQDFINSDCHDEASYKKIERFCDTASNARVLYAWADTCCIDKTSSAELSEAINSMFAWYHDAKVCYAYLSDVTETSSKATIDQIRESRWLTRGWTLQELLAPKEVFFYNAEWRPIGSRSILRPHLEEITGIKDLTNYRRAPVAQKFSWAAKRRTTRLEDVAYSLLGLFDVNMPLLYGEGSKAFIRLQKAILEESDDETIFAWGPGHSDEEGSWAPLLAKSPLQFADCADIEQSIFDDARPPWGMTNHGFQFTAFLYPALDLRNLGSSADSLRMILLNCRRAGEQDLLTIFCDEVYRESQALSGLIQYRRVMMAPRPFLNWNVLLPAKGTDRKVMRFSQDTLSLYQPYVSVERRPLNIVVRLDTPSLELYGFTILGNCYYFNGATSKWDTVPTQSTVCGYLDDQGSTTTFTMLVLRTANHWAVQLQRDRESTPYTIFINKHVGGLSGPTQVVVRRGDHYLRRPYLDADYWPPALYSLCPSLRGVFVAVNAIFSTCDSYGSFLDVTIAATIAVTVDPKRPVGGIMARQ